MRATLAMCAALAAAASLPVFAAPDAVAEAWLLYEQGKARMETEGAPELGEALLLFARAIDKRGGAFPEAEAAIGDVYNAEGAYALAQQQYEKALQDAAVFDVPEETYQVLYRLADLAERQQRYADMERHLTRVLADQVHYAAPQPQQVLLRDSMRKAYLNEGLDEVLLLYRFEQSGFAVQAHGRLGWLLYRWGRYDSGPQAAVVNLLFAVDIAVTELVRELRLWDPEYVFSTLPDLLRRAAEREYLLDYVQESRLIENVYYLADATWAAQTHPSRAMSLWRLLADGSIDPRLAAEYADKARRQLQAPRVEPYLHSSPRSIEYNAQ